jgi:hypothetical protein
MAHFCWYGMTVHTVFTYTTVLVYMNGVNQLQKFQALTGITSGVTMRALAIRIFPLEAHRRYLHPVHNVCSLTHKVRFVGYLFSYSM